MFFHPTLRHITLSCTNFDAEITHDNIPPSKRKSTPLQSLTLIECNVNVKFLDVMLSLPKALKQLDVGERLHVFPECYPSTDRTTRTSDPLFVDALARQADSLERLSHISGHIQHLTSPIANEHRKAQFRDLKNLKYLELCIESTLFDQHLAQNDYPDSIQTLKVTDATWSNAAFHSEQFLRHPRNVLRRCNEVVSKHMSRAVDIDVRFTNDDCEQLLSAIPTGNTAHVLPEILGSPIRSPVYKLATSLKSRGKRLRLFVQRFSSGKTFIPPYMYGEEVPHEAQFYDSDDFWRFSGTNFRVMDDEDFQAEVHKMPRMRCTECVKRGRECFNSGDGKACIFCEGGVGECVYQDEVET